MADLSRCLVLLLLLGFTACYPTSREPIGVSGGAVMDARLEGAWRGYIGDRQDGPAYLFFLRRNNETLEVMLATPAIGDGDGGWANYALVVGRIGEEGVMNARALLEDGASADTDGTYTPLAYHFTPDGRLHLFMLPEDSIEKAIRDGRIAGEVDEGRFFSQAKLTADRVTLDAFFSGAMDLFAEELGAFDPLP